MVVDLLGDGPVKIIRPNEHEKSNYSNLSNKFKEQEADFRKQYYKIYNVRLERMFELLNDRINHKWDNQYPVVKVHKLQEEASRKCIIIGTLFKDQKLKPSILKKLSEKNSLIPQPVYTHFTDDSDQLFIEDESQRYQVFGNIDVHKLVTGISCALLGSDQGNGKFLVEEYCFVECRPQIQRPLSAEDHYICFLSGLDLVNYEKVLVPLKLCVDYLLGFVGDESSVSKITRLIIAGNSIRAEAEVKKDITMETKAFASNDTLEAVKKLDVIISQFARVMNVDLMPGANDPSNHLLAQQAMHKCMFPLSSQFDTFNTVTNPYECTVDGIKVLGSSGQPVTDIINYSRIENPVEALEKCIVWSHICPTSPDTLGCYPYYDNDPFIIEECPHVFFAGNQPEFVTNIFKGAEGQEVRLVCIPQFSNKASVVLFNLRTFECHDMSFGSYDI